MTGYSIPQKFALLTGVVQAVGGACVASFSTAAQGRDAHGQAPKRVATQLVFVT